MYARVSVSRHLHTHLESWIIAQPKSIFDSLIARPFWDFRRLSNFRAWKHCLNKELQLAKRARIPKVKRLKPDLQDLQDLRFPTWPHDTRLLPHDLWSVHSGTRQSKESKNSLCCRSQRNGDSAIKWSEKDLRKGFIVFNESNAPKNCWRSKSKGWIAWTG